MGRRGSGREDGRSQLCACLRAISVGVSPLRPQGWVLSRFLTFAVPCLVDKLGGLSGWVWFCWGPRQGFLVFAERGFVAIDVYFG